MVGRKPRPSQAQGRATPNRLSWVALTEARKAWWDESHALRKLRDVPPITLRDVPPITLRDVPPIVAIGSGYFCEDARVFVWIFHRITGVLLVVFLAAQLITGFFQASSSNLDLVKAIAGLHRHAVLSCLLVFVATFHAMYGVRTILLDLGVKREKFLFWAATGLGWVLFGVFLVFYFRLIAA